MSQPLLSIRNLHAGVGDTPILRGLDLDVRTDMFSLAYNYYL